jgi:hypothetical protein
MSLHRPALLREPPSENNKALTSMGHGPWTFKKTDLIRAQALQEKFGAAR